MKFSGSRVESEMSTFSDYKDVSGLTGEEGFVWLWYSKLQQLLKKGYPEREAMIELRLVVQAKAAIHADDRKKIEHLISDAKAEAESLTSGHGGSSGV